MSARARNRCNRNPLTVALLAALLLPAGVALAQEQSSDAEKEKEKAAESSATAPAKTLDSVSVVGSRIKRADVETASPVQIISREELDREGHQSVGDMLQTLTQGTTGDYTGDYFVNGFTPNAQTINLRAVGPGYTLVLVNGRRLSQYPMPYNNSNNITNVRTIPTSIIERSEVLTGGASAIYGSDAVAGVVNLVTRKNYEGNQVRLTTGTTEEGGGDSVNFELTGGRTGDRWSAVYAFQYSYNEPIFASQRDLTADIRSNPYGLAVSPQLSLIAIDSLGLTVPRGHNALFDAKACDALGYDVGTTATRGNFCGSYDQVAQRSLFNKQKFYSTYGYGTFDLTDNTQLFGSLSYYQNEAVASSGLRNWYSASDRFLVTPTGASSGGQFYDPNIGAVLVLQRFFRASELGGLEAAGQHFSEKTWTVEVGAKGSMGRFDWEASANYARYDFLMDIPNLLEKGVHDYFLGPRLGFIGSYPIHELNVARWNAPLDPATASQVYTRVKFGEGHTTSQSLNFIVSGDLFELPAGPVGFAGVIEGNRQTIDRTFDWRLSEPLGENTLYGLGSPGLSVGTRDRYAVGAEFRIPLLSNLTASIAGRYDLYDDITNIDDAKTWNFGLEYRPFSNLLLRGNYATSFRAPDFQMIYSEGAAGYSTFIDEYACRSGQGLGQTGGPRTVQDCNKANDPTIYSIRSLRDGNPSLKEEEGSSWGVGLVWDIVDNLSLTVDYYDIKLEDRAISLSAGLILQQEADCRLGVKRDGSPADYALDSAFCQAVLASVSRRSAPNTTEDQKVTEVNSTYINAAYQRVTGTDATLRYRWDTDSWGTFRTELGWTIELKDEYQRFSSDPIVNYRDMADSNSRSRMRGSLGWSKNDWSANTFFTRYGTVYNWAETERLAPWFLWNLNVSRKFGPNTSATLAVNNVFNNQYRPDPSYTGYPYYYGGFGSDLQGRRYYLTLQHRF